MCAESTHAVSSFQTASIRSLRPSEILVLSPATQRRKPILPIRPRKPTRPRRNQKSGGQHRNLDIRLRPVRQTPLQRTPRQTRLDEYRPQNAPTSSGTERDYFRSTPTKAATPISTPTKTATNRWRKSLTTPKTANNTSPISTPTKSAYRAR